MSDKTSVFNDTSPTLRGIFGGTLRYFAGQPPRTAAGSKAMETISNITGIPDSNRGGCNVM